ncbi:MAG: hypothetical protein NTW13_04990 [Candidatus Omnitrophica bacterium]|nr:hypothetical protein [Candidatus Omnitrophota bacterium]
MHREKDKAGLRNNLVLREGIRMYNKPRDNCLKGFFWVAKDFCGSHFLFLKDKRGQNTVEYLLIFGLLVAVTIAFAMRVPGIFHNYVNQAVGAMQ